MERVIARVLFWGGVVGVVLMLIGWLVWAGRGGFERHVLELHRTIRPERSDHPPEVFVSLPEVLEGLAARPVNPLAVTALGLVVLLVTPVAGVAVAIPAFLRGGDRRYAVVAGIVLSMLLTNLLLAGGAG